MDKASEHQIGTPAVLGYKERVPRPSPARELRSSLVEPSHSKASSSKGQVR